MDWLIAHAEVVSALVGAATAAWAFLAKLDASYRSHLKDEFASKNDFERLEHKVDRVVIALLKRKVRDGKENRIRPAS